MNGTSSDTRVERHHSSGWYFRALDEPDKPLLLIDPLVMGRGDFELTQMLHVAINPYLV